MPTYLMDAKPNTPKHEIFRAWNAGWDKEQVRSEIVRRYGKGGDADLDTVWAHLQNEFGEAAMPILPKRSDADLLREMNQTANAMRRQELEDYLSWKGVIGSGAQLRQVASGMRMSA